MEFDGKVVLITGAGSGMGRLAAQNHARAGALVAALDVNGDGLRETADGHDGIRAMRVDVVDDLGRFVGRGYYNPQSTIAVRISQMSS